MSKPASRLPESNVPTAHFSPLKPLLLLTIALGISGSLIAWSTHVSGPTSPSSTETTSDPPVAQSDEPIEKFLPTKLNTDPPPVDGPPGMVWIPGGEFSMGCDDPRGCVCGGQDAMQDARPIHRVAVDGYWMDATEVTNEQFAKFVDATKYVTIAEKPPSREQFRSDEEFQAILPEFNVPGSTVFTPTDQPVPLDNFMMWWRYERGANWRHPDGPSSHLDGKEKFPVVHVAYPDVLAYCQWAGKRLPTEAEWEFAARGGLAGQRYTWGDELKPDDKWQVNIWQGKFPMTDRAEDGFQGIAPVAQFAANPFGLFDMSGNVWEWCSDWYHEAYYSQTAQPGTVVRNPQGPNSFHYSREPGQPVRVRRGGSFLCSDAYCIRYMIGTRGQGEVSTASNHCGFRCVITPEMWKSRQVAQQSLKSQPSSSGATP